MKITKALLLVALLAIARCATAHGGDHHDDMIAECKAASPPWAIAQCCALGKGSKVNQAYCTTCVKDNKVGNNKAYACHACAQLSSNQGDCSSCVTALAGLNREWACPQVCFNKDLSGGDEGVSGACTDCYKTCGNQFAECGQCMRAAADLAAKHKWSCNDSRLKEARFKCMNLVKNGKPENAWAASQCLRRGNVWKATACLRCLEKGTKAPWQCQNA